MPTRNKGMRRRASGKGQSGAAENNSKARALVAMIPSTTPAGHMAPVGTISSTGEKTASCPSSARLCGRALRFVESACEQNQHVSRHPSQTCEMSLARGSGQPQCRMGRARCKREAYVTRSVLEWKAQEQPHRPLAPESVADALMPHQRVRVSRQPELYCRPVACVL